MDEPGPDIRVERKYYDDGTLAEEVHYRGKKEHGPWRRWHPNGVLAEEFWFDDGLYHTGVNRSWDDTGQLRSEVPYVNCQQTGRMTVYDEKGRVVFRHYAIDGRKVSPAKYRAACDTRPELPRYPEPDEDDRKASTTRKRRAKRSPADNGQRDDTAFIEELLSGASAEALGWLRGAPGDADRSLGDMAHDESVQLVERLYAMGAMKVHAVQMEQTPGTDDESTNHLLIELPVAPDQAEARASLFEFENQFAESEGFEGEADRGQKFLYLKLG